MGASIMDGTHGDGENQLERLYRVLHAHFGARTVEQKERAAIRTAHLLGLIDEVNADPTIASVS
jgi:hypothetical protein